MARPLIPFVQNGYYASRNWIPLVKGNGFTTSGGGEQEEVWETASGPIVTFDGVAAPLRQLSVAVEPVQSGSGDPSPTNVRPITGWNSVTVNRTGKNLLSSEWTTGLLSITVGDDINAVTTSTRYCHSAIFQAKSGLAFSITSHDLSKVNFFTVNMYMGNTLTARYTETISSVDTKRTYTVPANTYNSVRINIGSPSGVAILDNIGNADIQLELGSTATAYEPYSGNTYTIQLGETVYGGTLDVVNGKMSVDRAMVDLSTLAWQYNTTWAPAPRFYSTTLRDETIHYPGGQYPDGTLCSSYIVSTNATVSAVGNDKTIAIGGDGYIYIQDASYDGTTLNDFKAALSGVQFVYMLATPFELTLTPEQISTVQGTNNVWSDAGDVTVEYRAR